jgi:hypothetical protein
MTSDPVSKGFAFYAEVRLTWKRLDDCRGIHCWCPCCGVRFLYRQRYAR